MEVDDDVDIEWNDAIYAYFVAVDAFAYPKLVDLAWGIEARRTERRREGQSDAPAYRDATDTFKNN